MGNYTLKLCFTFILAAFMWVQGSAPVSRASGKSPPFLVGEKLRFQVRWAFIPAGEFVLEVLPMETIEGKRSYHFLLDVRTYPMVDIFYKVRARIEAFTDEEMTHSLLYKKNQKGKSKRNVLVTFDYEKLEARYSNFGVKRDPVPIAPGSFDPLSVFYAFRLVDLKENMELEAPVSDGKKSVIGKVRVLRRERISVPGGIYDTFLVEPDLKSIGGVFKRSKNAKLKVWVTTDRRHIPVRIKSKVRVGYFVADLLSVENTAPHSP